MTERAEAQIATVTDGSAALPVLAAATMMLSAGLVFSVQPLFGRLILPYFGGVPSVWNTAMLFFQTALLLGYAYAHLLERHVPPRGQIFAHGALLLLSMLFLPAALPDGWLPQEGGFLPLAIILVLSVSIGVPFVVASATAPLLQSWYARARADRGSDPYFLYGASNLGSLLGLISYPLLIEPGLGLGAQGRVWGLGFGLLGVGVLACGLLARSDFAAREADWRAETSGTVLWRQRVHWMALAAAASSLLIAVTQHVSTNVTAMPLLWVAPLTLYLATFIIAFSRSARMPEPMLKFLVPFAATLAIVSSGFGFGAVLPELAVHYSILFLLALFCHADLYARRPAASHLTDFYLCMSVGGLLGTAFNSLAAPFLFTDITEYPIAVAAVLLLWAIRYDAGGSFRAANLAIPAALFLAFKGLSPLVAGYGPGAALVARIAGIAIAFAPRQRPLAMAVGGLALLFGILGQHGENLELFSHRGFFGVHRVKLDPAADTILLVHGDTTHGAQSRKEALMREPLGYYGRKGPLGQLFAADGYRFRRVGVVGLGTASVACYSRPDMEWTFFEIDPAIVETADARFSYLRNCAPGARILLGDGRLLLAKQPDAAFDLTIIDAFSSDAVPLHLLTREAIALYLSKLAPGGVLMIHISNRFMRLAPVVADLIEDAGLEGRVQSYFPTASEQKQYLFPSVWVAIARDAETLAPLTADKGWAALRGSGSGRVWTDDYANVAGAVIWTQPDRNR
jgi:hypothetical protein